MRVIELGDGARLPIEALAKLRIYGEAVGEDFDRDGAIQPRVAGFVHLSHAADADERKNLVRAETGTWLQWHQWSRRGLYPPSSWIPRNHIPSSPADWI